MGHGCGTLLCSSRDSYGTLYLGHSIWDSLVGHSCGSLLWVTLVGSSCEALLWDALDTTNHPAHQRHAAFTPACFALPSGTAPRKRTFHQGRANPNGTATSRTSRRHTVCPDTRSKHVTRYHKSSRSPATRRVYASMFRAPQWHGATQTHFPPRPRKSQWHCNITNVASPHGLPTHLKQTYHTITNITPLTSDTPRLRQPVSRSLVAQRHANALSTKAAQIHMALRRHERRVATRSAHTLEANISRDTTYHPAHQRHAAFTPACFALSSGTAPRKRTFHQGCANPNGTATSRTSCRGLPAHYRSSHASVSYETSSKSQASRLQDERFVRDFLQKSRVKSPKRAFRTRLPQKVTRQVSKTSVSHETSSKTHTSKSAKRAFRTRLPPKVKRKHPSEHTHHAVLPSSFAIPAPPNNTRSHANPNVTATFTSTTTHNLTIPCACHESFRVHTSNAHKGTKHCACHEM